MKKSAPSIPDSRHMNDNLKRLLSAADNEEPFSITGYLERGAGCITPEAVTELRRLRPQLYKKIDQVDNSDRFRLRLRILAQYFEEGALSHEADHSAYRETVFALLYFLKGFDRIPDSIPEIGLLDDAMIVQVVLQQNAAALRAHWLKHGRVWPSEL